MRTLTSVDRLRDVLACVADDFRLECRFTIVAGSEFAQDTKRHLERRGMRTVGWSEATGAHWDLAISPNTNGDLHELSTPLITLPHGAGYHKNQATKTGHTEEISGLSRAGLVRDERVVPSVIGVSHQDQIELLRRTCPDAVERARVIGDPCYDRLRASVPLREHYRQALRIGSSHLVLISSTWGPHGLFGNQPELASRLVNELTEDYRVALVLHPNVWDRHGAYQIHQWTTHARSRGLLLIPPDRGWQATLTAADTVLSDHGSVAFYSAALGKRLLLGEFAANEVVPDSPMAELGTRADRLDPARDLRTQIDRARPAPDFDTIAARTFAPGSAAERLRTVIYEQLGLTLPEWTAPTPPVELFSP